MASLCLLACVSFIPADGGLNCFGFHAGEFTYKSPEGKVKVVIAGNIPSFTIREGTPLNQPLSGRTIATTKLL